MDTILPFDGRVDRYELIHQIGEGGMGTVYLARHDRLQKRQYAVKVIHDASPSLRLRFEREIDALDGLTHPNIVSVVDAGQVSGTPFLVMEYIDGASVSSLLKQIGRLTVVDSCEIVRQIAAGLHHVHERGLVHRDIKPANIMVSADGVVKILDLGLARLMDAQDQQLTATNQVFGTPDYMSPEQCDNSASAGPASDLYSLGCTFFCLLTGRPPFGDDEHATAHTKMRAHLLEPPASIQSIRPDVPTEIREIVSELLAKSPENRIESAEELGNLLRAFSVGANLRELAPLATVARDTQEHVMAQVDTVEDSRPSPKATIVGSIIATAIAIGILALGLAIWNRRGNDEPSLETESPNVVGEDSTLLPDPKSVDDHDRRVAMWVFSLGGKVSIAAHGDSYLDVHQTTGLPTTFRLQQIDFSAADRPVTDEVIVTLDGYGMPHLRSIILNETRVTDEVVFCLKQFQLDDLCLSGTALSDRGLEVIGTMPTIHNLDVSATRITDAGLDHLLHLEHLLSIDVSENPKVTTRGIARLKAAMPDLEFYD
jgi:serine/threonine protein kinase